MGYDLGVIFLGATFLNQKMAEGMIEETLHGKPEVKKQSLLRTFVSKISKR
jgi:hypothetical protein